MGSVGEVDTSTTRDQLISERQVTMARIAAMTTDFDAIVAASSGSNIDDEHDPEGPTLAFERAQVAALLDQARAYLCELDLALTRLDAGVYSVCEGCGVQIATDRLEARPATRTCIVCSSAPRHRGFGWAPPPGGHAGGPVVS